MSENVEKKGEAKEEPKAKEKEEAPAPEPAEKAQAAEPKKPAQESEGEPRREKLSRLPLKEIEEKLKVCQEKMGGVSSQYARFLLRRKQILTK